MGCGFGPNAIFLGGKGVEVTGIDLSPEAIAEAQDRLAAAGVLRCHPLLENVTHGACMPPLVYRHVCSSTLAAELSSRMGEAHRTVASVGYMGGLQVPRPPRR